MTDYTAIAQQFVPFYYQTFDTDRKALQAVYREGSMLTFETSMTQGAARIVEKLAELPFQKVVHKVITMDAQPNPSGGVIVLVTGQLLIDDSEHPQSYSQVFFLVPEGGSYYVQHDLFKLIYG